jgi:hypothetical protein
MASQMHPTARATISNPGLYPLAAVKARFASVMAILRGESGCVSALFTILAQNMPAAKPLPHLQRMGRLTPAVDKSIDKGCLQVPSDRRLRRPILGASLSSHRSSC